MLFVAAVPTAPAAQHQPVRFELLDDGSIVVPVTIAGAGPFRFVLDTGSTRTAVSQRLASSLRLPVVATSKLVTPTGDQTELIVALQGLALGGLAPTPVKALVSPRDDLAAGRRVDGLVGQDVLAPLVYTIDYVRRHIVWNWEPDSLTTTRLPLDYADGRFMVTLSQRQDEGGPLQFVPDSGSDGFVLFARRARQLPSSTPRDVGVLSTLGGHTLVRRVLIDELRIGGIVLRDQPAVIVQPPGPAMAFGDGLLPLHVFGRVTFNGPARYLVIEEKGGKIRPGRT
jgi:predicted aspartyl protease